VLLECCEERSDEIRMVSMLYGILFNVQSSKNLFMKIFHGLIITFLILEAADIVLTEIGISLYGLSYEKNAIMQSLMKECGRAFVYLLKLSGAVFIVWGVAAIHGKQRYEKLARYLLLILCLIALYGVLSSIYVLFLL